MSSAITQYSKYHRKVGSGRAISETTWAVSYTHLDVYKRQGYWCFISVNW